MRMVILDTSWQARPGVTVVAAVAVRAHGALCGRGAPCPTPGGTLAECQGTSAGGELSDFLVVRFSFLHPHGSWGPRPGGVWRLTLAQSGAGPLKVLGGETVRPAAQ